MLDDAALAALAELLRAEDLRSLDAARLGELIEHPLPVIREHAAFAAGRIGDLRASEMLVNALDDSTRSVAAAAAFALGELGDTSSSVLYALVRKLGVSWAENDVRGVEAVAALGKLGSPGAHAAIRQVLQRYIGSETETGAGAMPAAPIGETGMEALLAIWKFPRSETDAELVTPHLTSPDDEVRWRATYVFTRVSSPRSIARLRERLTDEHPLVRALAARALRATTVDSARQRPQTVAALRGALEDPHPHVPI
ncbi:MAG: HEAT repeat domain-containing protein, partial [Longimicrobiales bacterium]